MAMSERDRQLEADLAAERAKAARTAQVITAVVGILGIASIITYLPDATGGSVVAAGRAAVGVLGLVAAVLMRIQPQRGWLVAMAWAVVQIPVYAWTPEGSPNLQIFSFPLSSTSTTRVNGQIVAYSQIGVNLVGLVLVGVLRAFKSAVVR